MMSVNLSKHSVIANRASSENVCNEFIYIYILEINNAYFGACIVYTFLVYKEKAKHENFNEKL